MTAFANAAAYKVAIQSLTDTLAASAAGSVDVRVAKDKAGELVAAVARALPTYDASAELTPSA